MIKGKIRAGIKKPWGALKGRDDEHCRGRFFQTMLGTFLSNDVGDAYMRPQQILRVNLFRRAMLIKRTRQIGSNCIGVAVLDPEARNEMHELAVFEQGNRR